MQSIKEVFSGIIANLSLDDLKTHCIANGIDISKLKKKELISLCIQKFEDRFFTKKR
jgi:hypothetical protein